MIGVPLGNDRCAALLVRDGQVLVRERELLDQLLLDLLDRGRTAQPIKEPNDGKIEVILLELSGDHAPVPPARTFSRFLPDAARGTMA